MSRRSPDHDRGDESRPIRKIDDASYGKPPATSIRRRLVRGKRWFLLDANRWLVTGLLLLGSFVAIVAVGSFGPVPVDSFLTTGISPGSVLVELLKMIVSVVVIVLSINQLVLSPGLGPVGDQENRFEQTMALRASIEEHADVRTSPTSPAHFLRVIVEAIADQAAELERVTAEMPARAFHADTTSYAEDVETEANQVAAILTESRFGRFDVISATLRFAITEKVRTLRDIRREHEPAMTATATDTFDEMDDLLELFTVAREYIKTVYIRSEYIELSEGLLYIGLPTIVLTYVTAQLYSPGVFPGATLGFDHQLLFVAGAVTVALAPVALLVSYVFRLAALSRSTLLIGPFAARSAEETDPRGEDRP